jgi:recombination protein RecT
MATKEVATVKTNVGDSVIARVNSLCEVGFTCPKDYNYINAIKASMLVLQELKDKNGKPALEVATQASIATALFEMSVRGLDASKKTCYFVMRGDKLCLHESYFGKVLQVKRIYPNFDPHPVVIHEGDEFVYEIDPKTGCKKIVKHSQSLENLDKDFVGAYMYLPTADGSQDLYIMSKKQIMAAWSKSSSRELATHKQFSEKMVAKTIINSGCNIIINSTPDLSFAASDSEIKGEEETNKHVEVVDTEIEEVTVDSGEVIDLNSGEVLKPAEEKKNEPEF